MCPKHSEAKQYQNVGVWSRERFIAGPCKETGGSYLKTPKLPESFQQSPLIGKVREGSCSLLQTSWCQILCSWGQVMMFLLTSTETNVILCSDKKGQGPKAQLLPSKVQAGLKGGVPAWPGYPAWERLHSTQYGSSRQCPGPAEKADLSWQRPQGQVPDSAQPSSRREPGAQDPASPQAFHLNWRESFV